MDWTSLPPLSALRAFSAYAQTGSVTKAGALLNVSHAAISQQMRSLETRLGIALLDRSARAMALTTEGQQLADALAEGFGRIAQVIDALTGADADRPLQVATTPSFAAHWLMPRLAGFRAAHPEIDIMINPSPKMTNPAPGGVDVALRFGLGHWPGLVAELLTRSPVVVVAAPSLIGDLDPQGPEDLLNFPWLQELGTSESSLWLAGRAVSGLRTKGVIHVPGNLVLDGARSGQGVAISTRLSVEADLRAGRLRLLFEEADENGYHIVTAPGVMRPPLRDFVIWLRREVRPD
ncbi:MAG: LysR family transcriptional regulator [Rhodobacterales bacterium]|nr:LysR family transcriptional regulator [Puniceibacterium antarcticum]